MCMYMCVCMYVFVYLCNIKILIVFQSNSYIYTCSLLLPLILQCYYITALYTKGLYYLLQLLLRHLVQNYLQ